jgi:16S rRNA (guanine527-N7)-methyltransferase
MRCGKCRIAKGKTENGEAEQEGDDVPDFLKEGLTGMNLLEEGLIKLREGDGDIEAILAPRFEKALALLNAYIVEVELFNPAYGLVGTQNRDELIVKHILDSLTPLGIIRRLLNGQNSSKIDVKDAEALTQNQTVRIADVGSGAGLPGIPLAVCLPDISFTLIERMGRRTGFLRNTQAVIGLSNIVVEETEMEKAAPNRFGLITFRAFRPLDKTILKGLFRLCSDGGILAAYKGRRDKIDEEMAAAEKTMPEKPFLWEAIPCTVPFLDEERHLLVIKTSAL